MYCIDKIENNTEKLNKSYHETKNNLSLMKEKIIIVKDKKVVIPKDKKTVIPKDKKVVIPKDKKTVIPKDKKTVIPQDIKTVIAENKKVVMPKDIKEVIAEDKNINNFKLPNTRYQGSKRKIISQIYNIIIANCKSKPKNILDLFGGSSICSLFFQLNNINIIYNDIFKFNCINSYGILNIYLDNIPSEDDIKNIFEKKIIMNTKHSLKQNLRIFIIQMKKIYNLIFLMVI